MTVPDPSRHRCRQSCWLMLAHLRPCDAQGLAGVARQSVLTEWRVKGETSVRAGVAARTVAASNRKRRWDCWHSEQCDAVQGSLLVLWVLLGPRNVVSSLPIRHGYPVLLSCRQCPSRRRVVVTVEPTTVLSHVSRRWSQVQGRLERMSW